MKPFLIISDNTIFSLENPSDQSLKKFKNQILKKELKLSDSQLLQANKHHQRGSDFFSASYSGEWLFLAIGKRKIGVDIELIQPRSLALFNKYSSDLKLFGDNNSREYFYRLWTAREAILKLIDANNLDLIQQIVFLGKKEISEKIGNIYFDHELNFSFYDKLFCVKSFQKELIIGAVCLSQY